jgi:hypothetical protein
MTDPINNIDVSSLPNPIGSKLRGYAQRMIAAVLGPLRRA